MKRSVWKINGCWSSSTAIRFMRTSSATPRSRSGWGYCSVTGCRNLPYISASFSEFWTRWHISLSTWLRTYLYIPLGGNRHETWRTYLSIMIVMGLGGLWHGAALSYLAWGTRHGVLLVLERLLLGKTDSNSRLEAVVRPVRICFVFFS